MIKFTSSTTPGAGRYCAALFDLGRVQRSPRCCTRTVRSRSHRLLTAMTSRMIGKIATTHVRVVSVQKGHEKWALTWHDTYAIERGVTLCMFMIWATWVLTFLPKNSFFARLLFSVMLAPSPSPRTSFAEEGDVNIALNAWQEWEFWGACCDKTNLN